MRTKWFIIILLTFLAAGCSLSNEDKIEMLFEKMGEPQTFQIIFQDQIIQGLFVLLIDDTGFRHAIYSHKTKYWNVSGNSELHPSEGIDWGMNHDPNIPIASFAGVITNDEIQKVVVRQKTLVNEAVIVTTAQGRYWYTYFDILEKDDRGPDPLKIEALSSDGEIVWKDGVYDKKQ